jgi:hypothetical protein
MLTAMASCSTRVSPANKLIPPQILVMTASHYSPPTTPYLGKICMGRTGHINKLEYAVVGPA